MGQTVKSLVVWIITSRLTVKLYLWGTVLLYLFLHQFRQNWIGLAYHRSPPDFSHWMRILENTLLNSTRNRRLRQRGLFFPSAQTWFLTNRCNRACPGCPKSEKAAIEDMTEDDWVKLGKESIVNGCMIILILGGEPMLMKEMIKRIKKRLGDEMIFIVFTNGDLVTEQDVIDFRRLGIALAINVYSGRKDDSGAFRALELAQEHGVIAGASITITQENYLNVTSLSCMKELVRRGALFAFHFHYIPVGVADDQRFVLHEDSFWAVERRLVALNSPLRIIHYSQCRAGHAYVSIDPSGDVRLCAFCTGPRSLGNVRKSTLLGIFNSDGFAELRQINASQACMVLQKTGVLVAGGFLPASVGEAVKLIQYPRGYIRRPRWRHHLSVVLRDWVWNR
ncbi:MAG: radical SAM protein [Patescibacteria group bacterium]|nr:radical SAM protein [Patescibacteria group bacterium]MDD5715756.1 radical SAM protein [Patescibacteria group bacterium]